MLLTTNDDVQVNVETMEELYDVLGSIELGQDQHPPSSASGQVAPDNVLRESIELNFVQALKTQELLQQDVDANLLVNTVAQQEQQCLLQQQQQQLQQQSQQATQHTQAGAHAAGTTFMPPQFQPMVPQHPLNNNYHNSLYPTHIHNKHNHSNLLLQAVYYNQIN